MKNEIFEFFQKSANDMDYLIETSKTILNKNKTNEQRAYILLNILYEYIKDEKMNILSSKLKEVLDEISLNNLLLFSKEETDNIIDYFTTVKIERENQIPKLLDFEWKFIGLTTLDKFEIAEYTPKILLRLIFNNGQEKIIETDFSNFKKLHEEIDENLSSMNSVYAKRIVSFSK